MFVVPAAHHLPEEDVSSRQRREISSACVITEFHGGGVSQKGRRFVDSSLHLLLVSVFLMHAENHVLASHKCKHGHRVAEARHSYHIAHAVPVKTCPRTKSPVMTALNGVFSVPGHYFSNRTVFHFRGI